MDRPSEAHAAALAALVLGATLWLSSGHNTPGAVAGLAVAVALALLAVARPPLGALGRFLDGTDPRARGDAAAFGRAGGSERSLERLLAAGVLVQLALLAAQAPGPRLTDVPPSGRTPLFYALLFALALWTLHVASPVADRLPRALRLALGPALLGALHLALGAWLLHHAPDPHIDVDVIHRQSLAALLDGRNPYALTFPNIYGTTIMYGPEQVAGGRLAFGYCYPPLALLATLPGHLLGDYRLGELAAITATGMLLSQLRRPGEPWRVPLLAAALLLTTPRGLYVVEHGWTDPIVGLTLALVLFSARRARRLLPFAIGLFLVAKQYTFVAAPLLAWLLVAPRAPSLRAFVKVAAIAALAGAAVVLPFFLWSPRAFLWSVVTLQFYSPFRRDGLSFAAFLATHFSLVLPSLVGFLAAVPVVALGLVRAARSEAGTAAATAATFLVFFACNKQAFANYYFFVLAALVAAVAATRPLSTAAAR